MPDTTAEDVLEGIERVIVAAPLPGTDRAPVPVFRGNDEAGVAQRDTDRVFTVLPVSDLRHDKRSGGSVYRLLTVSIGVQYHRNKATRRKMLADSVVLEDSLRHVKAGLEALALPVLGVKEARLVSGPNFDWASKLDGTKAMTVFVLEVAYHTATG